jgi:glycosyltransferase involved in cell wall biosynthesis
MTDTSHQHRPPSAGVAPGPVSVIVPAHNEGRVIRRTLDALLEGGCPGELDVVVVCNGCADDTAAVARSFGGCVRVIETEVPSKTHALNLGDRAATGFPRVYLDGDVVLPGESLWRLVDHLRAPGGLATAPHVRWDLRGASLAVRAFYAIDGRLPSSKLGIGGTGVYAVSAAGRARFGEFPNVTADDMFVRAHFKPHERRPTPAAYSIVTAPKKLAGVIAIKTRGQYGNYELAARLPSLDHDAGVRNRPVLLRLLLRPHLWPALAVYGYAKAAAKLRAARRFRAGRGLAWERDDTSRQGRPAGTPGPLHQFPRTA